MKHTFCILLPPTGPGNTEPSAKSANGIMLPFVDAGEGLQRAQCSHFGHYDFMAPYPTKSALQRVFAHGRRFFEHQRRLIRHH